MIASFIPRPFGGSDVYAKGSLAEGDTVKNVLIYAKDSEDNDVLLSQLNVEEMLGYLNQHISEIGKVHNYSILDTYPTTVHQEAQGFTLPQLLDYAVSKSSLTDIATNNLTFDGENNGEKSVSFWELDGTGFDATDAYTYDKLYGVPRYNYPKMYEEWNPNAQSASPGSSYVNKNIVEDSAVPEEVILSITAFSQRYSNSQQEGKSDYNMEGYFDSMGLLDTSKAMRLMLPLTGQEFAAETKTAMNSRYGISYIRFDLGDDTGLTSLGEVAKPTWTVIDGDEDSTDAYESGYSYFTFACNTPGATILYNDSSTSSYIPTATYNGQAIKVKKIGTNARAAIKVRAVKEGYTDKGVINATNILDEGFYEDVSEDADVWDGKTIDMDWYVGHEDDDVYTIHTAAELAGLAAIVNSTTDGDTDLSKRVTFAGKTVTLVSDIHLNRQVWRGIGSDMGRQAGNVATNVDLDFYDTFSGLFDGSGHTISGMNLGDSPWNMGLYGLFGNLEDATVKNLTVSGIGYHEMPTAMGGIAGRAIDSTIENCKANMMLEGDGNVEMGGIVGRSTDTTIRNCENVGLLKGYYVGGIVGRGYEDSSISDCINHGFMDANEDAIINRGFGGGIIGYASDRTLIANCKNDSINKNANKSVSMDVGGIGGYGGMYVNCVNDADIRSSKSVAGILNNAVSGKKIHSVSDCVNYGNLNGSTAYGIAGFATITRTINVGNLTGTSAYGLTGNYKSGGDDPNVSLSANFGDVYGHAIAAGLIGTQSGILSNSFNQGAVHSDKAGSAAGLVWTGRNRISNCYDISENPVIHAVSGSPVFDNVFYLDSGNAADTAAGAYPNVTACTESAMKNISFVNTDLGAYNAELGELSPGKFITTGGGYPALYWLQKSLTISAKPSNTQILLKDASGVTKTAVTVISNSGILHTYPLIWGASYTYQATAPGYHAENKSFHLKDETSLEISLLTSMVNETIPSEVTLNWADNPQTTQSVSWADSSGGSQVVQYIVSSAYSNADSLSKGTSVIGTAKKLGSTDKTYYNAQMTGLEPNTTYYYRVGTPNNWSEISHFTTAQSDKKDFKFLFMGDIQRSTGTAEVEYPQWGKLLGDAYTANPDIKFGLTIGDMVQSGSDLTDWKYFLSYAQTAFSKIPLMPNIGNHESNFANGKADYYLDIFNLPKNGPEGFEEEFYSFDYGNVHITALNSWALSDEQGIYDTKGNVKDETTLNRINQWIEDDLASTKAKFKIITMHHPIYAMENDAVSDRAKMQWEPIFIAQGVDLGLVGHQHVYSRTYSIADGNQDDEKGITYVMGNAGLKYYNTADDTYVAKIIYNQSTYQILDVSGDTLSLKTYDRDGKQLDTWSKTNETIVVPGDVDDDGVTTMEDVNRIKIAVLAGGSYDKSLDANGDNVVDIRDAQYVLRIVNGR
jgi:hypothetical protein